MRIPVTIVRNRSKNRPLNLRKASLVLSRNLSLHFLLKTPETSKLCTPVFNSYPWSSRSCGPDILRESALYTGKSFRTRGTLFVAQRPYFRILCTIAKVARTLTHSHWVSVSSHQVTGADFSPDGFHGQNRRTNSVSTDGTEVYDHMHTHGVQLPFAWSQLLL